MSARPQFLFFVQSPGKETSTAAYFSESFPSWHETTFIT
jgi:hypothetical protein